MKLKDMVAFEEKATPIEWWEFTRSAECRETIAALRNALAHPQKVGVDFRSGKPYRIARLDGARLVAWPGVELELDGHALPERVLEALRRAGGWMPPLAERERYSARA